LIGAYNGIKPAIHPTAFVAESADLFGDITIGQQVGIWYKTVARGDVNRIVIGNYTNIQDCSIIHSHTSFPVIVGDYVTVGHGVILHGCTIGNNCLIGMGSIILDGVTIGDNVIIGAGSLVTEGKKIPSGSLVFGSPAKVVRQLTEADYELIRKTAEDYMRLAGHYKEATGRRID
jgi:carbonic anhydrase/acetyltransferase-like protein (isoleucine patch superfamily)